MPASYEILGSFDISEDCRQRIHLHMLYCDKYQQAAGACCEHLRVTVTWFQSEMATMLQTMLHLSAY